MTSCFQKYLGDVAVSKIDPSWPRVSVSAFAALFLLPTLAAAQETISDPFDVFPLAVHCELKKVQHIFYLSRVDANGVATYISPGRMAGTITVDGTAQRVGGDQAGSCKNKTLKELRDNKQTIDTQR